MRNNYNKGGAKCSALHSLTAECQCIRDALHPKDLSRGAPKCEICLDRSHKTFLDSSMVEHPAVNRRVAGSSPARGAKKSL